MNTHIKMYKLPQDGSKPVIDEITVTPEGDINLFGDREPQVVPSHVQNLYVLADGEGMLSGMGYNKHLPGAMGDAYIARVNYEGLFVDVLDGDIRLYTN